MADLKGPQVLSDLPFKRALPWPGETVAASSFTSRRKSAVNCAPYLAVGSAHFTAIIKKPMGSRIFLTIAPCKIHERLQAWLRKHEAFP